MAPEQVPVISKEYAQQLEFRDANDSELANQIVNRGGITLPFELAEEMGASLADVATAFVAARELFELRKLWRAIDATGSGLFGSSRRKSRCGVRGTATAHGQCKAQVVS